MSDNYPRIRWCCDREFELYEIYYQNMWYDSYSVVEHLEMIYIEELYQQEYSRYYNTIDEHIIATIVQRRNSI